MKLFERKTAPSPAPPAPRPPETIPALEVQLADIGAALTSAEAELRQARARFAEALAAGGDVAQAETTMAEHAANVACLKTRHQVATEVLSKARSDYEAHGWRERIQALQVAMRGRGQLLASSEERVINAAAELMEALGERASILSDVDELERLLRNLGAPTAPPPARAMEGAGSLLDAAAVRAGSWKSATTIRMTLKYLETAAIDQVLLEDVERHGHMKGRPSSLVPSTVTA